MSYQQVDLLEVHAWGHLVGAVAFDQRLSRYAFEYSAEWRERGIELAPLHMALSDRVYAFVDLDPQTYHRLPAMLADSLPDRFGNALVTAKLTQEGIEPTRITSIDRLAYMSDRAMGALEFRPPGGVETESFTALQLADLVTAARAALRGEFTGDDTSQDALAQLIQVGTSAGGARAKAVVSFNPSTQQIRSGQLPAPEGFEPWLLKLDGVDDGERLGQSRGYGRIEFAYHHMAAAAGITMTECRLLREGDRAHFMTRRFDRLTDGAKIHAQTLCAIDHLDFNLARTHSYAQYLDVIDRLQLGPEAREEAFRRIVFNIAAVNRDDHTKNLSFLCADDGSWTLAPAYDITHSHNPKGEWTQHQMSVNGKFDQINRSDLLDLADRFAVPSPRKALDQVIDAVSEWPSFAARADVNQVDVDQIAADMAEFMPR